MRNGFAGTGPVKRSPEEWREIFRYHEETGGTVKAFCAARGISPKTFW